MLRVVCLAVCAVMSACGANSYCLVQQDYQKAQVVPELQSVEGLEMPASPSALRLPDAPANAAPFGVRAEDGTGMCLDKPPQLALPALAPESKPAS